MSPEQFQFLRDRIAPKILVNGFRLNARPLLMPFWQNMTANAWLVKHPWLWTGAALPTTSPRRNKTALIRSPGLPVFPYTKGQVVPVHRLLHHLLIGPVTPHDQVRYQKGLPIQSRPDVNPCHHIHHRGPVYEYEPPSLEEAGGYSVTEELRSLLREGKTVQELLMDDFTQEEIDAAQAPEA